MTSTIPLAPLVREPAIGAPSAAAAQAGAHVRLYEMRPVRQTPAHRTDKLAEIVCSNSLKSDEQGSAPIF